MGIYRVQKNSNSWLKDSESFLCSMDMISLIISKKYDSIVDGTSANLKYTLFEVISDLKKRIDNIEDENIRTRELFNLIKRYPYGQVHPLIDFPSMRQ